MHFGNGCIPESYTRYMRRKVLFIAVLCILLSFTLLCALSLGAVSIPFHDVLQSLMGVATTPRHDLIIWNIRLPQALCAMLAGAGLSIAGAVMQSILRNPLGSPFTLGISHAAAFGAALSVMLLDSGVVASKAAGSISIINPYLTTCAAFIASLVASGIIVMVSRLRSTSSETMILTGVALSALFTAGTMFLQYFADDVQLAAMIFWTFGDTARASWSEISIITTVTLATCIYFLCNAWSYNAIDAGDETARALGVPVDRVRIIGMLASSLLTAVTIAYLGIIGFVGLVVPHMVRSRIGADHRFLLPACLVGGAVLLLAADTVARLMLAPHVLPVSILTAFMGAPVFIALIIRGRHRS